MLNNKLSSFMLPIIVLCAGVAALSWELLWQHYTSLALGVSAAGTAITLAITMAGMTLGSLLAGKFLNRKNIEKPLYLYGVFELIIGFSGLLLPSGFKLISKLDSQIYQATPLLAPITFIVSVIIMLIIPALAMGATIPVLGLVSKKYGITLSRLYAFNTGGAALGICLLAFFFLPNFGVTASLLFVAMINISVAGIAFLLPGILKNSETSITHQDENLIPESIGCSDNFFKTAVFLTGFVTFTLEVVWFRSIRAAFTSTTDVFAIILFTVLISLAIGAALSHYTQRIKISLPAIISAAGISILIATPFVERIDLFAKFPGNYWLRISQWLGLTAAIMGIPFTVIGIVLPRILDQLNSPRQWALMYGINTIGAVVGSISAAWIFLQTIGSSQTAWLAGSLLVIFGVFYSRENNQRFIISSILGILSLAIAIGFYSGVGKTRVQGRPVRDSKHTLIEIHEGVDVTSSVVDIEKGRILLIDGFSTTGELANAKYMDWMGRLPMLLHPDPQNALVICFGTGQTAHGVRDENPKKLDIVDINPHVFEMSHHFETNKEVLKDQRVRKILMDGRAWLRRTNEKYDVITLEPMPPNFAGTNALYSKEFYETMATRLNEGGIAAQWLPFHIVSPEHSVYIAAAFQSVFEESILWIEPQARTGILMGRKGKGDKTFGVDWPGFDRLERKRLLSKEQTVASVLLNPEEFKMFAAIGYPVTDDNQVLAYGTGRINRYALKRSQTTELNFKLIEKVKSGEWK